MNARVSLLPVLALACVVSLARADSNPDFESDAKPILARQPGLIDYVHKHFDVKETGVARVPGEGDAAPQPPFIFNARPKGHSGPFYLALLIQPGPPGHIMKVADVRKLPLGALPPQEQEASAPPPSASHPAPATPPPVASEPSSQPIGSSAPADSSSSGPTADTPSGPIKN